jgi:AraC-like DNA-binding protein
MRTSPREYLTSLRMNKAAELLCDGFGVTVTAASVGYPDVFSFSRAFKNYYGLPPTEYVKTKRS